MAAKNNDMQVLFPSLQGVLDFSPATTNHPANVEHLTGQNRRLYDWLAVGNSIHIYSPAMQDLKIGYLNSRISDLRNKCQLTIYSRSVQINGVYVNEYSFSPFQNQD